MHDRPDNSRQHSLHPVHNNRLTLSDIQIIYPLKKHRFVGLLTSRKTLCSVVARLTQLGHLQPRKEYESLLSLPLPGANLPVLQAPVL